MNELNQDPLDPDKMNEPNQEPLDPEKINGLNQEPLNHEKTNAPNQKPLGPEKMNEPNQEPLDHEKMNEPNQEPLEHEKMNEPNQEPLDHEKMNEPNQEPSDPETMNEPNQEPDQKPADHDKSADQLGSPNVVKKITNTVRNVTNYLQSNGSRAFIWGRPEIGPENNADANTGMSRHATDGPKVANDDTDLLTTIHITQKQIDKRLQCTVCLDEYELGEEAIKLTCSHIFHEKCITHWIIMHGTCPVCRRYFCPGELHLPLERVGLFRSIARRVYRTILSPLVYFFPSLGYAQAMYDRRRPTPMYRLIRAERVTSPQEPVQSESSEIIDDYIFCHVMFALQNANNEQHPGPPNTVAVNMQRRRFNRFHREPNVDPTAGENPPPVQTEFRFPHRFSRRSI
ncbi:E3 ubiquitin-protein ligase RNF126 isoform X2 [Acyrthosiphon pisum]|uniref:RING-type domain-containing protein n=1 Tax=Acyrthosiphon pisum TaxID=7029 RepID=A0A8R2B609_ACYPI|nr:E3 ubiquitin-protein ligase RNF126 isoform X2 [Acyrthosiphon pisum]|eukprot:XP_008183101.1 PREDICTED: E3 ubiquitin-protein ligase RNF126-like isoform X2 [Acyrthosiphon pisum]